MMERLVEMLREGGTRRVADLARNLDTTPQMVEMMLDDLTRMGILRRIDEACSTGCSGCSLAGKCATGPSGRSWVLAAETR